MRHALGALILGVASVYAAQHVTELVLPRKGIFPESITSTSDGTLIIGSLGHGNVSRSDPPIQVISAAHSGEMKLFEPWSHNQHLH